MNRVLITFLLLISLSCDDGNFDVPEFDFSSIDIDDCGDVVLFKINENETLVIEIDPKLNGDEETFLTFDWDNKTFSVTENGTNKITYRTLSEKPTANYFCQNIPPTSPAVISEWKGTGTIIVNTILTEHKDSEGVAVYATSKKYKEFFNDVNYQFIKEVEVGNVSGSLMVYYRDEEQS